MKKNKIRKQYYEYVIKHKRPPKKLKSFLAFVDISKEVFHEKYSSLKQVELDIWKNGLKDVLNHLANSDEFTSYNHRDRASAFMFSWFEFMNENKRYFKSCSSLDSAHFIYGSNDFKKLLKCFIKKIVKDGMACQDFKDRGISQKYTCDFFTSLFFMNLNQWKKCGSKKPKNEEYMDGMVEKSMMFFFDSLAPNLFDTFVDFMKHKQSK